MTERTPPLAGRLALVTGASRRLGRAIAEGLADAGADVALHCRNDRAGAEEAAAAIRARGRRAWVFAADLADAEAAAALAEEVEAAAGPLYLLVNNAATFRKTPLETLRPEDFDEFMGANARSVYVLSLVLGRRMKARGEGVIVNLADVAGLRPWPSFVPYSASKAAVVSLTLGMARLLAPEVRVNAIAPGPMLPPAGEPPEQGEQAVRATLLGRWGNPRDVAEAAVYLATAPYVTGVILPVDGGRSVGA
jgi:pteridine reductase